MQKYREVSVAENGLEDLIRQAPDLIETGLRYVDHQRSTERGPLDVLLVDNGGALVIAELKVVEDDSMLVQGIDYYDYLVRNVEAIARMYQALDVDPKQTPRLFLIAPSFSIPLLNRWKWINVPISLFTVKCIELIGHDGDPIPVFTQVTPTSTPVVAETESLDDHVSYVTDPDVRKMLEALIDEIRQMDQDRVVVEPRKYWIAARCSGRVFAYLRVRRGGFVVETYDSDDEWKSFPIKKANDLKIVRPMLRACVEDFR